MRTVLLLAALLSVPAWGAPPDARDFATAPAFVVPAPRVAQALDAVKSRPRQYAAPIGLALSLRDGAWDVMPDGTARWRLRVQSVGATSLSLTFERVALPAGAELWLYDEQGAVLHGPYTQRDRAPDGRLWTPIVAADTIVAELRVPIAQRAAVGLAIAEAQHGYREPGKAANPPSPGESGACNIDVACSAGDPWRAEIRAAALITIGNIIDCSGVLVNNTTMSDDALILTANHCLIEQSSSTPAASVIAYWNYQAATCNGSRGNPNITQTTSGSSLVAQDRTSDFTLVHLNSKPADSYHVYYAGWDVAADVPQSGATIHHPHGDFKRIAIVSSPAQRSTIDLCDSDADPCPAGESRHVSSWQVRYSAGTTEQGSSGAGLWNQNRQVVGVLSGGSASCTHLGDPDDFGRLEVAWANSSALRARLDSGNTGATTLCGREPGSTACGATTPVPGGGGSGGGGGGGGAFGAWTLALLALASRRRARLG